MYPQANWSAAPATASRKTNHREEASVPRRADPGQKDQSGRTEENAPELQAKGRIPLETSASGEKPGEGEGEGFVSVVDARSRGGGDPEAAVAEQMGSVAKKEEAG